MTADARLLHADDDADARACIAALESRGRCHDVAFAGCRVRWRAFGHSGPPVVLLHGGHGSWLHWARNIDALAERCTVWVPDMPAYGDSEAPAAGTFAALVEVTMGSLNALVGAATPIGLAGFSFGGLVAAHLAAERGHVMQLALFGPGGHGGKRRPRGVLRSWREAAQAGDAATLAEVMRHNLAVHMLHAPESIDALALRLHTDACLHTRFRSRKISLAGSLADALDRYAGPALLAWGEHDVTADPASVLAALCTGRPEREGLIVEGAGHWFPYERAERANELLRGWLDRFLKKRRKPAPIESTAGPSPGHPTVALRQPPARQPPRAFKISASFAAARSAAGRAAARAM